MFKNSKGQVRSGWLIGGTVISFYIIVIILSLVTDLVLTNVLITTGDLIIEGESFAITETGAAINEMASIGILLMQEIIIILCVWFAWKKCSNLPMSLMGMKKFSLHAKECVVGMLMGIGAMTVIFAVIMLTGNARIDSYAPHFSLETLLYVVIYILVAFAEEMLGRGYIMGVLRSRGNNKYVIFICSMVVFALLHSGNQGISIIPYINLALVGGLLSLMFYKSGNLWMSIGLHFTWNLFQGLYGFPVSGTTSAAVFDMVYDTNNVINGGTFGPEGGIVVTVVTIILCGCVYMYYRKNNYKFMEEVN